MKKFIITILVIAGMLFSCSPKVIQNVETQKYGVPVFFQKTTDCPKCVLDSICNSEKIEQLNINNWQVNRYITNDSLIYTQFIYTGKVKQYLYIFSYGKYDSDKVYLFKFRKE